MRILSVTPPESMQEPPVSGAVRSRVSTVAIAICCVLGVAAGFAAVAVPAVTGGMAMTVLTGSMEPALPVGSVAIYRPVDPAALRPGDVIVYRPDTDVTGGVPITHRIIRTGNGAVIVQGDANAFPDKPVRTGQIIGKLEYSVPYLGMARVLAYRYGPTWAPTAAAAVLVAGAGLLWVPVIRRVWRLRPARGTVSAHVSG